MKRRPGKKTKQQARIRPKPRNYRGIHMLLKILAGTIFNLLGLTVIYKGVKTIRSEGIKEGFIDIIIGLGFVLIGLLIWAGFIS